MTLPYCGKRRALVLLVHCCSNNRNQAVLAGCVYVFYLITRCMRPEGPWQRLAAALADSSAFLTPPKHDQTLSSTTVGYAGATPSPPPRTPPDQGKGNKRTKERYILGRARPVLLALLPWDLLSIPILVNPGPGQLRQGSTSHPRIL